MKSRIGKILIITPLLIYIPHSADVRRDFTIFPAIVFLNITLLIQAYVFRDISHFLDHLPSLRAFILYF